MDGKFVPIGVPVRDINVFQDCETPTNWSVPGDSDKVPKFCVISFPSTAVSCFTAFMWTTNKAPIKTNLGVTGVSEEYKKRTIKYIQKYKECNSIFN